MEVRLTVIGCSPAHPNPGGAHSGYLLESPGCGRLLLDCGPGVLSRLRAQRLLPVAAIAVTHMHLDHWGDLVPWAWLALYGGAASDGGPGNKPKLWVPPDAVSDLAVFAERFGTPGMFEAAFDVAEYTAGRPFDAAGYEVEPWAVQHFGVVAFGFRVRDREGHVLGYSGDSAPCDGLRSVAYGSNLFLCEATLAAAGDDAVPRGHLSADEALALGKHRVLLTHRPVELPLPAGAEAAEEGSTVQVGDPADAGHAA
jgi:ribonuclease BN (tRNA processing enzyme)